MTFVAPASSRLFRFLGLQSLPARCRRYNISLARSLVILCAGLGLLGPEARAQFVGYTSPQTVQQKIFTAQTAAAVSPNSSTPGCVPTAGNPCAIPNLGQNVHSLTYTTNGTCANLDVRLEGSIDGTTFFAISQDATDFPFGAISGLSFAGGVSAVGYYPVLRANLVAISGCNISASYAGTSGSPPTTALINQQASLFRYVITQNTVTSAAFSTITIPTPFGNSSGSIWLQCSGGPCASGGAINVFVSPSDSGLGSTSILFQGVGTVSSLQRFDVASFLTNRIFISITPTAASTNTWSIYYNFALPGSLSAIANSATGHAVAPVGCNNFTPINTTASLQLLAGAVGKVFYICSWNTVVSAADNIAVVEGTGSTCGTATAGVFGGATAATGWNLAANGQVTFGSGLGFVGKTGAGGNNLCLLVSSAAQVSGGFTWTLF